MLEQVSTWIEVTRHFKFLVWSQCSNIAKALLPTAPLISQLGDSDTPVTIDEKKKKTVDDNPAAKRAEHSRKAETPEKSCERLSKTGDFIKHVRKNKTEEEREERLSKDAEYKAHIRTNQTEEEREERLRKDAECKAHIRDNERQNKADMEQHEIQFPPIINEDIERRCLADYIEATSNFSLRMSVCGICAKRCHDFEMIDIWSIPNRELINDNSYYVFAQPVGANTSQPHTWRYQQF